MEYFSAKTVAVAFGDLDGDGDADAATVDNWPHVLAKPQLHFVTVHRNAGDGVFEPAEMPYPVGEEGTDVALGDLDGDGDLDAAVPNARADTVSILLNKGDATFAPHVTYGVGQMPRSLGIADLDADGDLDLAILNTVSHDVSILSNNGNGSFAPEVRVLVGNVTPRGLSSLNFPYPGPFLAVGDLDGDGDRDIAIPAKAKIKLLLNNGSGAFTPAATHPGVAIGNAYSLVIADLDGDSDADLAASCLYGGGGGPNCLSVIMNQGGVYAPPVAYNGGWHNSPGSVQWATSLTAGDLDADTDIDLVVGHEVGDAVMLMRNHGDGTFAPKEPVHAYDGPWYVRFTEVNGDGRADLAALTFVIRSKMCILLNDGAGALLEAPRYPPAGEGEFWNWAEAADLDGDGDQDLVAANQSIGHPHQVKVLLNDGNAAFEPIGTYSLGPVGASTGESIAVGDLNGDEVPDLVIADDIAQGGWTQPGKVWTMMGAGRGTFEPAIPYPLTGVFPLQIAIADFDGDTDNDLAVGVMEVYPGNGVIPVWRRILIFENSGAASFSLSASLPVVQCPWPFARAGIVVTDLNADGKPDLVGAGGTRALPGAMATFLNAGGGNFVPHQVVTVAPQPESMVATDVNADGHDDIVILHNHNFSDGVLDQPYLTSWINDGAGSLVAGPVRIDARMLPLGRLAAARSPVAGATLLASPNAFGTLVIDTLLPSLTFGDPVNYGTGYLPTAAVLADFSGDGRIDIAASAGNDGNVSILLNRSCVTCPADCNASGALTLDDFSCFQSRFQRSDPYADCNADGALTIADFGCFQTAFVSGCP